MLKGSALTYGQGQILGDLHVYVSPVKLFVWQNIVSSFWYNWPIRKH